MHKTSECWLEEFSKEYNLKILDPDGWDRNNFQKSFKEELIDKETFLNRVMCSTISCNPSLFKTL